MGPFSDPIAVGPYGMHGGGITGRAHSLTLTLAGLLLFGLWWAHSGLCKKAVRVRVRAGVRVRVHSRWCRKTVPCHVPCRAVSCVAP